ncbi:MAG: hypothetical protein H6634_13780 [Anaerolineales bacterium]|nr:hypothetical protein [Anaerolineales bacterium]
MDKETLNLLIGAGISIFSSLIGVFATNFFQSKNNNQERNYQILLERINQLEEFSKKITMTLGVISINFRAEYIKRERGEREKFLDSFMNEIISLYPFYGYYASIALYLKGDIANLFSTLLQKPNELFNELVILQKMLHTNDDDEVYLGRIIERFEYINTYSKLLAAFDKAKAKPRKI